MTDYDIAYYQAINVEEGPQAKRLAEVLLWKYQPKSVIDIGCATGLYLKPFLDLGIKGFGIDNAQAVIADEVLQVPRQYIQIADITATMPKYQADLALCLEVLEHIPESGARSAVKYITASSKLIIFSAAQPGQGGRGHINCQPKTYWQKLFEASGFERQRQDETYLGMIMAAGYHLGWLLNNLMVFGPVKP